MKTGKINKMGHYVPVRLSERYYKALAALAAELGGNRSEAIRVALRDNAQRRGVWPVEMRQHDIAK